MIQVYVIQSYQYDTSILVHDIPNYWLLSPCLHLPNDYCYPHDRLQSNSFPSTQYQLRRIKGELAGTEISSLDLR